MCHRMLHFCKYFCMPVSHAFIYLLYFVNTWFQNSMSEIAQLFTEFFRDLDVVPSDIVAGLVLLRHHQKQRMKMVIAQVDNFYLCYIALDKVLNYYSAELRKFVIGILHWVKSSCSKRSFLRLLTADDQTIGIIFHLANCRWPNFWSFTTTSNARVTFWGYLAAIC